MIRKCLAACGLALAVFAPSIARADAPTIGPVTVTKAATGVLATQGLSGQKSCSVALTIPSGASVSFNVSVGGTTYSPVAAFSTAGALTAQPITTSGTYDVNVASKDDWQIVVSAYSSGTVSATYNCSAAPPVFAPSSPVLGSSGATYSVTYPDQGYNLSAINTTGTFQVVAPVSGQSIYLWAICAFGSGNSSSAAFKVAFGPNSSTLTYFVPQDEGMGAPAANEFSCRYGTSGLNNYNVGPSTVPLILPAGWGVYYIATGSTVSFTPYLLYAQHG